MKQHPTSTASTSSTTSSEPELPAPEGRGCGKSVSSGISPGTAVPVATGSGRPVPVGIRTWLLAAFPKGHSAHPPRTSAAPTAAPPLARTVPRPFVFLVAQTPGATRHSILRRRHRSWQPVEAAGFTIPDREPSG